MDLVNLAVAVVFVSNAIILILLVYMLVRILGQTEQTRDMMIGASRELTDSARVVRDAGYKIVDALRGGFSNSAPNAPPTVTATPVAGIEMLDKLNTMMEEMSQHGGADTDRQLADIRRMMESMSQVDPSKIAEWHRKHKADLEHTLQQRDKLAAETEQMRQRLMEAHRIITELRKANKAAEAQGHTVEALRGELGKHQQILERAKERVRMAEQKAEQLTADVERLSAANPAGAAENEALKEARRRLAEVSAERDEHARELDDLKDAMQRTLVEKDFIEEHFLRLDGDRATLAAAAAAGDAAVDATADRVATSQNEALEPA
jgi:DNA repair exonuclease SbcCD ATPase subunit